MEDRLLYLFGILGCDRFAMFEFCSYFRVFILCHKMTLCVCFWFAYIIPQNCSVIWCSRRHCNKQLLYFDRVNWTKFEDRFFVCYYGWLFSVVGTKKQHCKSTLFFYWRWKIISVVTHALDFTIQNIIYTHVQGETIDRWENNSHAHIYTRRVRCRQNRRHTRHDDIQRRRRRRRRWRRHDNNNKNNESKQFLSTTNGPRYKQSFAFRR